LSLATIAAEAEETAARNAADTIAKHVFMIRSLQDHDADTPRLGASLPPPVEPGILMHDPSRDFGKFGARQDVVCAHVGLAERPRVRDQARAA
jgi:hypothetical protein